MQRKCRKGNAKEDSCSDLTRTSCAARAPSGSRWLRHAARCPLGGQAQKLGGSAGEVPCKVGLPSFLQRVCPQRDSSKPPPKRHQVTLKMVPNIVPNCPKWDPWGGPGQPWGPSGELSHRLGGLGGAAGGIRGDLGSKKAPKGASLGPSWGQVGAKLTPRGAQEG